MVWLSGNDFLDAPLDIAGINPIVDQISELARYDVPCAVVTARTASFFFFFLVIVTLSWGSSMASWYLEATRRCGGIVARDLISGAIGMTVWSGL